METNLNAPACEIQQIGEAAWASLSAGHAGRVMAVVTRAAYLLDDQEELFWLTAAPGPMHRRCLQVSPYFPRLEAGSRYQVREGALVVGRQTLRFGRPSFWISWLTLPEEKLRAAELYALVDSVFGLLLTKYEPVGWGGWIAALRSGTGFPQYDSLVPDARVQAIQKACRTLNPHAIPQHAAGLVGLGEGLTPSGDDFLGGLLFGFYFLRAVYPEIFKHSWNYSALILQLKSRTNLISFTLLNDHAEGHTLEPLQQFAGALIRGKPAAEILPFAEGLIRVGHSTGWNLLTGFLVGMNVLVPR